MWASTPRPDDEVRPDATPRSDLSYVDDVVTAQSARALCPSYDIPAILTRINEQIVAAAKQGSLETDIAKLFPFNLSWPHALVLTERERVFVRLRAAGYSIKVHAGGHSGSTQIIVSWGVS